MIKSDSFEIKNVILCEDVRQERSNKFTLIGVFSGDVQVESLPANVSIAVFMEGNVRRDGRIEINLRFSGPGDVEAILKTTVVPTRAGEPFTIAVPRLTILMESEGEFHIDVAEGDGDWVPALTKNILIGPLGDIGPRIIDTPPSDLS